ncbi:MAG: hypothetical protein SangKO_036590 [Sandaracinaceae bacterium]
MRSAEELQPLARRLRRARLFGEPEATERCAWTRADLERALPHRGPMLLLDGVEAIDLEGGRIRARREVAADALGLDGHFPGAPIYPGVLQVEMIGQAGLCLARHLRRAEGSIDARVIAIHHASFLAPVRPGETLTVEAARVDDDAWTGTLAGQVWAASELKSSCIVEVYFVDAS